MPLIVMETASEGVREILRNDTEMAVWWGTRLECVAGFNRLVREGIFDQDDLEEATSRLDMLAEGWTKIRPQDRVRHLAENLAGKHPLKAADALQLAAALRWCEGETEGASFVCLDRTLRRAATDEGFDALPETEEG
jgi:uncharacterized protein